jgi:hypothetical protein
MWKREEAARYHSPSRARIIAVLSGFLHLDPIPRRPRPVGRGEPLRYDAFEPHPAGVPEDRGAFVVGMAIQHDPDATPTDELREPSLAIDEGQRSQVLAVEFEEVEGVQHRLADGAPAVQGVEDRDAIRAAHHGLAIDCKRRAPESGRGAYDRRVAVAPVVAAPGEQANGVALPTDLQPIAVVLDPCSRCGLRSASVPNIDSLCRSGVRTMPRSI